MVRSWYRRTWVNRVRIGIAATPDQMMTGRPATKTHIPGLLRVGASTRSGHGITGVMHGGIATATAVLGRSAVTAART